MTDTQAATGLSRGAAEKRFRVAFDHAPIGMALFKPTGRFVEVNAALCQMLGYEERQLVALSWMDITHPEDLAPTRKAFDQLLAGVSESIAVETRCVREDGQIVWGKLRASVVRNRDGEALFIGQIVDVTDLKHSYERLEELVRSKDELVASVSHELRTPLTAVLGFAELLQEQDDSMNAASRREMIETIANQAFDLSTIVEDLLVAARAEMGTLSITTVPTDVRAQMAQVIEGFEDQAAAAVSVAGGSFEAAGDPNRVRQILRNLVSNAIRYGDAPITVDVRADDATVHISVADGGGGVPLQDPELIFEPYFRAHEAAGVSGSVGLGLTVSRKLARLMGGDLVYRSGEGRTTFELTLPRTEG